MSRNWGQETTRNYMTTTVDRVVRTIHNNGTLFKGAAQIAQRLITILDVPDHYWDEIEDRLVAHCLELSTYNDPEPRLRITVRNGFRLGKASPKPLPPLKPRTVPVRFGTIAPAKKWEKRAPTAWLTEYLQEHGPTPRRDAIAAGKGMHGQRSLDEAFRWLRDQGKATSTPQGRVTIWELTVAKITVAPPAMQPLQSTEPLQTIATMEETVATPSDKESKITVAADAMQPLQDTVTTELADTEEGFDLGFDSGFGSPQRLCVSHRISATKHPATVEEKKSEKVSDGIPDNYTDEERAAIQLVIDVLGATVIGTYQEGTTP